MKRLRTYRKHLRIERKFHELLKASATVSTKKFSQSKSEEISKRSNETSKSKSSIKNSIVLCCFFFLNSIIFSNSWFNIVFFFSFINSNCFCKRVIFALTILTCFEIFFSSRKRRSRFLRIQRYLIAEKEKSQSRSRRTHFRQMSELSFTRHCFDNRAQLWHERITNFSELTKFNCFFRWLEEFFKLTDR